MVGTDGAGAGAGAGSGGQAQDSLSSRLGLGFVPAVCRMTTS